MEGAKYFFYWANESDNFFLENILQLLKITTEQCILSSLQNDAFRVVKKKKSQSLKLKVAEIWERNN